MSEASEFWQQLYRERGQAWSGRPNVALVREVADLRPGTALDLGSGEGGDSIWLAGLGWRVTAVDIAANALAFAAAAAREAGVDERIEWVEFDLAEWRPGAAYDLVSAQFLHSTVGLPRVDVLRRAASAVARGGLLLVVGHSALAAAGEAPEAGHHAVDEMLLTPDEVLASLALDPAEWTVVTSELVDRDAVMGGVERHVVDNVLALRRR